VTDPPPASPAVREGRIHTKALLLKLQGEFLHFLLRYVSIIDIPTDHTDLMREPEVLLVAATPRERLGGAWVQ
jgi:hypothetical protein